MNRNLTKKWLYKTLFCLFYIFLIVSFSTVSAQQTRTITGTIYDSKTQQGIVGASVTTNVNGKIMGVVSDEKGAFDIQIGENTTKISVSSVGYKTQDIALDKQSNLTVYLESGVDLSEVVVTALGLERQSKSLGYAVQQIDGMELNKVKSANFLDNLAGKVAGLTITSGSTGVGSSTKINIRGESSFTNSNPLFVVDGIPINNNTVVNTTNDDANGFMEVDFGNGAMEVNQDDIESVTVLKGASAAALYGARASNGAIIIKTKTGAKSKGLGISFNTTSFMETPFQLPQFQNTYGLGNSGKYAYKDGLGAGINDNITYSYGPRLDAGL